MKIDVATLPPEEREALRVAALNPDFVVLRGPAEALLAKVKTKRGGRYIKACHWRLGPAYRAKIFMSGIALASQPDNPVELNYRPVDQMTWLGIPVHPGGRVDFDEAQLRGPMGEFLGSVTCEKPLGW